ncbi:MAG: hypothetical protein MUO77_16540, partial [Anaerolineales bacterium]|nr:hypothetical protein [Anaerolineales bacterium]
MKTNNTIFFLLSAIYISACGGVTSIPITTKTPTPKVAITTNTLYPTNTPTITPARWEKTSTPETILGYPTPQVPVELDPFGPGVPFEQKGITSNELYIGKYVLRKWCKPFDFMEYCAITISSLKEKQVDFSNWPSYLAPETGTDLIGTGYPDIVIVSEIGNAAGEQIVRVFEAGATLKEILVAGGRRDWKFEDLNNDKSFEFIGDARVWSKFSDCQILNFHYVYEYVPNTGYVIKTYKYKEVLFPNIQFWLGEIDSYKKENHGIEINADKVMKAAQDFPGSGKAKKANDCRQIIDQGTGDSNDGNTP